jgi:hypothetical protein
MISHEEHSPPGLTVRPKESGILLVEIAADWREPSLASGGPPPDAGASGAIATLSELVADLSRQLAQALKAAPLASRNSTAQP